MDAEGRKMIYEICALDLAAEDARLFMDTHPDCKKAPDYYNAAIAGKKKATADFEKRYGAITYDAAVKDGGERTALPWPWQENY